MSGVPTVIGLAAANRVVEVQKPSQETYKEQHPMEVNHVLEEKPNQELVQNNPALVRIICQVIIPGLIGMEIKLRAKIGQMTTLSTPVTVTTVTRTSAVNTE